MVVLTGYLHTAHATSAVREWGTKEQTCAVMGTEQLSESPMDVILQRPQFVVAMFKGKRVAFNDKAKRRAMADNAWL